MLRPLAVAVRFIILCLMIRLNAINQGPGKNAFYYNLPLTSINIPDSVTEIGERAFGFCKLESVRLPRSLEKIGTSAFTANNLKEIYFPAGDIAFEGNCVYGQDKTLEKIYVYKNSSAENYIISLGEKFNSKIVYIE